MATKPIKGTVFTADEPEFTPVCLGGHPDDVFRHVEWV